MDINKKILIVLIIANIPLYGALASILFGGKDGFWRSLLYLGTPDLISALKGEFWDDKWAELMMAIWIILCIFITYSEYNMFCDKYPQIIEWFN